MYSPINRQLCHWLKRRFYDATQNIDGQSMCLACDHWIKQLRKTRGSISSV
jgi:hypothetical protein